MTKLDTEAKIEFLRLAMGELMTLLHGQQGAYWTDERRRQLRRIAWGVGVEIECSKDQEERLGE